MPVPAQFTGMHGQVYAGDAVENATVFIMFRPAGKEDKSPSDVRIWMDSVEAVDSVFEEGSKNGATVSDKPEDKPWHCREASFTDPDGKFDLSSSMAGCGIKLALLGHRIFFFAPKKGDC